MAIRKILSDQEPELHKKCHYITKFDDKLSSLLDDLKETLADASGAGLAAPQIGILRRAVIVINEDGEMLELINPEIIEQKGEQDGLEGCLSMWVKVKAQDRNGNWFEVEGEEMTARCFCHEIEHLDGHVFTEHVERIYSNEEVERIIEKENRQKGRRRS